VPIRNDGQLRFGDAHNWLLRITLATRAAVAPDDTLVGGRRMARTTGKTGLEPGYSTGAR
jgi:hypothetical protein